MDAGEGSPRGERSAPFGGGVGYRPGSTLSQALAAFSGAGCGGAPGGGGSGEEIAGDGASPLLLILNLLLITLRPVS